MLKVQEMREIIRLIDQSSISEFVYENDGSTLTIKKPGEVKQPAVVEEVLHTKPKVEAPVVQEEKKQEAPKQAPKEEAAVEASTESEDDENIVEITSPMVGTFYRKPSPESDPYVQVGDKIEDSTIVCIVEAMKLFNEIEAETTGEIVEVLVGDGELVEYGQSLFKVKTQ